MSSLKKIRERLKTAQSLQKVTSAMKLMAGARWRSLHKSAPSVLAYASQALESLEHLDVSLLQTLPSFLDPNTQKPTLWIIATPDRGLCGGFYLPFLRFLKEQSQPQDLIWVFGEKGHSYFKRLKREVRFPPLENSVTLESFALCAQDLFSLIQDQEISSIQVIGPQFINIMRYPLQQKQLYPVVPKEPFYQIIEPNTPSFLQDLLTHYLQSQLYALWSEAKWCEQAARMMAMDQATTNTKTVIQKCKLDYNRLRQEKITKEILEIVGS